eukprot:6454766-Amphidinium_carterae.1
MDSTTGSDTKAMLNEVRLLEIVADELHFAKIYGRIKIKTLLPLQHSSRGVPRMRPDNQWTVLQLIATVRRHAAAMGISQFSSGAQSA